MLSTGSTGNSLLKKYYYYPIIYKHDLEELCLLNASCFWCGAERHNETDFLGESWRIDLFQDCAKGGLPDYRENRVLCCSNCFKERYGLTCSADSEEWAEKFGYNSTRFNKRREALMKEQIEYIKEDSKLFSSQKLRRSDFDKFIKLCRKKSEEKENLMFHERRIPPLTKEQRKQVRFMLFEGEKIKHCCWCKKKRAMHNLTLEHILPLSLGGSNWIGNMLLACQDCNEFRGNIEARKYIFIAHNPDIRLLNERMDNRRNMLYYKSFWLEETKKLEKLIENSGLDNAIFLLYSPSEGAFGIKQSRAKRKEAASEVKEVLKRKTNC